VRANEHREPRKVHNDGAHNPNPSNAAHRRHPSRSPKPQCPPPLPKLTVSAMQR
jgi:hypothetical protein